MSSISSDEVDKERSLKLLQEHEEEIVSALQGLDKLELRNKINSLEITPIKERILSLDFENLDSRLFARYVLQQVNLYIDETWKKFLNLLLSFRNVQGSANRFTELEVLLSGGTIERSDRVNEVDPNDILFEEKHLPVMVELLAECSPKWKEICLALGVPYHVREECDKKGETLIDKLYLILHEWVIGYCPDPGSATLSKLKKALSSNIVGRPLAAVKLEKTFAQRSSHQPLNPPLSGYTMVRYSQSILLGVEKKRDYPLVSYQWMKNGHKLTEYDPCHGTNTSILYVNDVTDSENYSCEIQQHRQPKITVNTFVEVKIPTKDKFLVDLYGKFNEIPQTSWPPVIAKTFITLVLIIQSKEFQLPSNMIRSIDDIVGVKQEIGYTESFGKYRSGMLLLVEGRPGSGKTTLVHKVVRDWATNISTLKGASHVFLISTRLLNYKKNDQDLPDFLQPFYPNGTRHSNTNIESILNKNGEGVCFIIDGLDEYNGNSKDADNIVMKLIYKKILPRAMVIVASRPVGTSVHRDKAPVTKRIEVLGFTDENIWRYVENYPFESGTATSKMTAYLKLHTNILHMCYLPVHASMVCYLYAQLGDDIPSTETKMYKHFTELTIARTLKRNRESCEFDSLDKLEGANKEYFDRICKLAFEMTKKGVQVIHQEHLNVSLPHKEGSDASSLGLIVIDSVAQLLKYEDIYTFLHLTFQEYLTSYYLSKLNEQLQIKELNYFQSHHKYQVMKFYCGQIEVENKTEQFQIALNTSTPGTIHHYECAFESQSQAACNIVMSYPEGKYTSFISLLTDMMDVMDGTLTTSNELKDCLYLSSSSFFPSDFIAIAYVLSTSTLHVSELKVCKCHFDEEGIRTFLTAVKSCELFFIKKFSIENEFGKTLPVKALNLLICQCSHLETIDLGRTVLFEEDVVALTENVTLMELKYLHIFVAVKESKVLEKLNFGSKKLKKIYTGSEQSKLVKGTLWCRHLSFQSDGLTWSHLFNAFKKKVYLYRDSVPGPFLLCGLRLSQINLGHFTNCVSFSLINCGINDNAVDTFTKTLRGSNKIELLCLAVNNITGRGAVSLATLIKANKNISEFTAACNCIDDRGAIALAESFKYCKKLKRIDLQCNNIRDEGATVLSKAIGCKQYQPELYIWNKDITETGITEVVKYSRRTKIKINLQHLQYVISRYPEVFNEVVKYCYDLKCLSISDILSQIDFNIDMKALGQQLQHFKNLQKLELSNRKISSDDAVFLAEGLKFCVHLKLLNLSNNNISSSGAEALAKSLSYCEELEVLNLCWNQIDSEGITALCNGLKNHSNLKELNLNGSNLSIQAGDILSVSFSCSLLKLYLNMCWIDVDNALWFAEKLKHFSRLEVLCLRGNELAVKGTIQLTKNLTCPSLKVLNLSYNNLQSESVIALSRCLLHCPLLSELDLSQNEIDDECMDSLTEALKYCQIKELKLSFNRIYSSGAMILASQLKFYQHLEELYLSSCVIDTYGVSALAEQFKHCPHLKHLSLDDNDITSEGALILASFLKFNNKLRRLYIHSSNSLDEYANKELKKQIKYCHIWS